MNVFMYFVVMSFIFLSAFFYVMSAFYHLKHEDWSFPKAFMVSMPIVFVQYVFVLYGNFLAYKYLHMTPSTILIINTIFCFICIWWFNYYVLNITLTRKQMMYEVIAVILILIAFYISNGLNTR
jgi:hypothetical protein